MSSEHLLEVTDDNFQQEILDADMPALVDFWAEWCMPCKMQLPTIAELAGEYAGRIRVGKLNTDDNRNVAMKYGISAIPTLLLFKGGQVVNKFVGLQQKSDLKKAFDEVLKG